MAFWCKPFLVRSGQVLYDNDMGPNDTYTICEGNIGENYTCDPQASCRATVPEKSARCGLASGWRTVKTGRPPPSEEGRCRDGEAELEGGEEGKEGGGVQAVVEAPTRCYQRPWQGYRGQVMLAGHCRPQG